MKNKTVVLAYSGGLDTSYSLKKLSSNGCQVHAITINTGGFSIEEINEIKKKAFQLGAKKYKCIDAIKPFYNNIIKYLIFGNILKNNTYPLSVSSERIIQAIEIVNYSNKIKAKYISHGSTGAGNDQVRFDQIFQILSPNTEIITLIRDNNLSREDEINYLQSKGLNIEWKKAKYSINKGLWGTSIGGSETLTSKLPLPEKVYPNQLKSKKEKKIEIEFKTGELVKINSKKDSPVNLIKYLQNIAEKYAIGRDIHVGDTIIGIKGRVAFEAAAPLIIIKAHHLLEKHTLTKWQQFQKESISNFYGMLLHEAQYFDPVMKDIESFLLNSQKNVSGTVYLKLKPYSFDLEGIKSKKDLMHGGFGTYGEINKNWTATDVKGFIKINANAGKIYHKINKEK